MYVGMCVSWVLVLVAADITVSKHVPRRQWRVHLESGSEQEALDGLGRSSQEFLAPFFSALCGLCGRVLFWEPSCYPPAFSPPRCVGVVETILPHQNGRHHGRHVFKVIKITSVVPHLHRKVEAWG